MCAFSAVAMQPCRRHHSHTQGCWAAALTVQADSRALEHVPEALGGGEVTRACPFTMSTLSLFAPWNVHAAAG